MYAGRHPKNIRSRASLAACRFLVAEIANARLHKETNLGDEEKKELTKTRDNFSDEGVRYLSTGMLCGDAILFSY